MRSNFLKYLYVLSFFLTATAAFGQPYGLSFVGNEAVQDERTGLDLSPGTSLCFTNSFELTFDISFISQQPEYFGYIVRIIDGKNQNFDLISNIGIPRKEITLVNGNNSINYSVEFDRAAIFDKWNKISIHFNYENQTITYSFRNKKHTTKIGLSKNSCFKILFGSNNLSNFKTTDVPPMRIRDIQIHEANKLTARWALNEDEGNIAVEEVARKDALVDHPLWIKKTHQAWKLIKEFTADGPISVAFDARNELLHFVGLDSLLTFAYANNQMRGIKYNSGRLNLLRGNQSIFDNDKGKLYNIYLDQEKIISFDFDTQSWDNNFTATGLLTDNWQYNKFYSSSDSSFYILGGYGHFLYKNDIRRYNLPTNTWQKIKPSADAFVPRYLAALGQVKGGAYLLGGYGTRSGQQVHNPKSLYDLLYFDIKDKKIKKVNELKVRSADFVLANSLVIDEKARSYYGLIFSKHKFNSAIQLIRGSLDSSSFTALADTIPYHFYDINSFADLYYSPNSKKFIAVTLFLNNKNKTEVAIYLLASPPLVMNRSNLAVKPNSILGVIIFIGVCMLLFLTYYYKDLIRLRQRKLPETTEVQKVPGNVSGSDPVGANIVHQNVIYLFGDLQLFDPEGNDITKYFTPLIKELFLVIFLYSIRWERGISSEKLKELLWFDKTVESARNNRSVNIAKLKTILDNMRYCEISKETGYWKANIDFAKINVDYHNYLNIVKDKRDLNKQRIRELSEITQRGSFLANLEYEWLDSFKSEISNQVIDIYQHFAESIEVSEDPEFLVEIANYIFYFDSVNEEAMMLKCKALVYLGKHSLAKGTFENFRKEYKAIYGEEFGKDFHAILE